MKSGKVSKGEYGYIAYQKKMSVIKTLIFFLIAFGVFAAGLIITGDRKNYFTIAAVLLCLPAAKSAVGAIMYLRASGCSEASFKKINTVAPDKGLFDLYMTAYSENYPLSHIYVKAGSVVGLCETGMETKSIEDHITRHMGIDGYKDYIIKIYDDADRYCERLSALLRLDENRDNTGVIEMLLAISL